MDILPSVVDVENQHYITGLDTIDHYIFVYRESSQPDPQIVMAPATDIRM
jgi:hypothetical protein